MTERNCSLYPGCVFLFWRGASALLLHQFQALKNHEKKLKSQYLKKLQSNHCSVFCFNIAFAIPSCYDNQKEKEADVIPKSEGSVTEIWKNTRPTDKHAVWHSYWQRTGCSPHTSYPLAEQVLAGSKA